jgi:hypothetical protein
MLTRMLLCLSLFDWCIGPSGCQAKQAPIKRSRGSGEGDLLNAPSLLGKTKAAKKQKAAQEKQQQTDCLGMPAPGTRTKSGRLVNKKGKSSPAAADAAKKGTKRAPPQVMASMGKVSKVQRDQLLQMLVEEHTVR